MCSYRKTPKQCLKRNSSYFATDDIGRSSGAEPQVYKAEQLANCFKIDSKSSTNSTTSELPKHKATRHAMIEIQKAPSLDDSRTPAAYSTPMEAKPVSSDDVNETSAAVVPPAKPSLSRADTHILQGASGEETTPDAAARSTQSGSDDAMDEDSHTTTADKTADLTGDSSALDKAADEEAAPMDTDDAVDEAPAPPPPAGPPPIDILISFDTTGSMSYFLDEVKHRINDVITRLFSDIPRLKIGVIAHGDYCDESVYYLTQSIELTNDVTALCDFVTNVEGTGGGDFPECYELILRQARQVTWTPTSRRALIMIGDACPHTLQELREQKREVIHWAHEANQLHTEQVSHG